MANATENSSLEKAAREAYRWLVSDQEYDPRCGCDRCKMLRDLRRALKMGTARAG